MSDIYKFYWIYTTVQRMQLTATCDKVTTELSSLIASSTSRRFGLAFLRKIAVARSSALQSGTKQCDILLCYIKIKLNAQQLSDTPTRRLQTCELVSSQTAQVTDSTAHGIVKSWSCGLVNSWMLPPTVPVICYVSVSTTKITRTWANAQPDGCPAEHRWRPLFNATKFGWRPLLDAVQ